MVKDEVVAKEGGFSEENTASKWQVFVNDMSWSSMPIRQMKRAKELPAQLTYDVPENVIIQARKPKNVFNDIIETHVYNALTKRYAHELSHAQIWIMFDEEDLMKAGL